MGFVIFMVVLVLIFWVIPFLGYLAFEELEFRIQLTDNMRHKILLGILAFICILPAAFLVLLMILDGSSPDITGFDGQ